MSVDRVLECQARLYSPETPRKELWTPSQSPRLYVLKNQGLSVPDTGGLFVPERPKIITPSSLGNERVMEVLAHPDDDICAAGTLAQSRNARFRVVFSWGEHGEDVRTQRVVPIDEMRKTRIDETFNAAQVNGVDSILFMNRVDGRIQVNDQDIAILAKNIRSFRPNRMLITSGHPNEHPDHQAVYTMSLIAQELASLPIQPKWGAPYEVPETLEMQMMHLSERYDYLVDTTANIDATMEHWNQYPSQFSKRYVEFFWKKWFYDASRSGMGIGLMEAFKQVKPMPLHPRYVEMMDQFDIYQEPKRLVA